nr:zinc finger protein OZF-like [Labrus bergylta]
MSGFQGLKELFRRRLLAAVIRDMSGQTTRGYEEELQYQRKLRSVMLTLEIKLQRTDVQQLLVSEEKLPPEQREWNPSLDQEDAKPPQIKKEQEELWSHRAGEQLQRLEEADTTKFPFTPVEVKSEDEETPQSSQCNQRGLQPETEIKTEDSSEPQADTSDAWKESREHQSDSDTEEKIKKRLTTDKKLYRCSECGKIFKKKQDLIQHIIMHKVEKPFSCSECGKTFKYKGHMMAHMSSHWRETIQLLRVCVKSFKTKPDVGRHMRVHTGEKPFRCSVCGKSFKTKPGVGRHRRVHTGEKPFSCSVCGKSFKTKPDVGRHRRVHTGEKPFSCPVCNKRFNRRDNVLRHVLVHTGEKPFSCSKYSRRFTQSSSSHMAIHTVETPFSCLVMGIIWHATMERNPTAALFAVKCLSMSLH